MQLDTLAVAGCGETEITATTGSFSGDLADGISILDLSETVDIERMVGILHQHCGISDLHLGVILDPFDELGDADRTNNVAMLPVAVEDCAGGSDISVDSFPIQRRVIFAVSTKQARNFTFHRVHTAVSPTCSQDCRRRRSTS